MIGCGAIAECFHLPALLEVCPALGNVVLVDRNETRLRELTTRFGVGDYATDYRQIAGDIDGAIVAVPPALHHPISMELLSQGVHVLCEKPLAETAAEARQMVAAAEESRVALCVNQTRRLFPAYAHIRRLLSQGALGELISIRYQDGVEFAWPAVSRFHFAKASHGVLAERGIHALDVLCWWLGVKPALVSSRNDSFGGPEGTALINMQHQDCAVELKLSWLTRLDNRFTIVGKLGTIEGDIEGWSSVRINYPDGKSSRAKLKCPEKEYTDFGRKMLANFVDVVTKGADPLVPGYSVLPAIELMEECYAAATRFRMPWFDPLETLHVE